MAYKGHVKSKLKVLLILLILNLTYYVKKQSKSECFQTLQELRNQHNLWNDASIPIQSQILGLANYEFGNYPEAIKLSNLTINLHQELPKENKNDVYLVFYFIKLGESYLMNNELDKAERASVIAMNILSKLNAKVLGQRKAIIRLMISIAHYKGEEQTVEKLKKLFEELED